MTPNNKLESIWDELQPDNLKRFEAGWSALHQKYKLVVVPKAYQGGMLVFFSESKDIIEHIFEPLVRSFNDYKR